MTLRLLQPLQNANLQNRLVELHWKVMVHMVHADLTEKQMPHQFWYYAIAHTACIMIALLVKIHGRLASPFLLVHGVGHNPQAWVLILSLCYFHHEKDRDITRSHNQAHTMDGIIVGHSSTSNAIMAYNPRNKKYYKPDSYHINMYHLPSSVYHNIKHK
jgi:hypothetical protein